MHCLQSMISKPECISLPRPVPPAICNSLAFPNYKQQLALCLRKVYLIITLQLNCGQFRMVAVDRSRSHAFTCVQLSCGAPPLPATVRPAVFACQAHRPAFSQG